MCVSGCKKRTYASKGVRNVSFRKILRTSSIVFLIFFSCFLPTQICNISFQILFLKDILYLLCISTQFVYMLKKKIFHSFIHPFIHVGQILPLKEQWNDDLKLKFYPLSSRNTNLYCFKNVYVKHL